MFEYNKLMYNCEVDLHGIFIFGGSSIVGRVLGSVVDYSKRGDFPVAVGLNTFL